MAPDMHRYLIAGLLLLLAACGQAAPAPSSSPPSRPPSPAPASSAAAKPSSQTTTIRVGGLGGTPDRHIWVGEDKGYYAEQGLKLDVTLFKSFTEMVPLLATGKLDVGGG